MYAIIKDGGQQLKVEEGQTLDVAYRDLANLVNTASEGDRGINVLLSREETYADISPLRLSGDGVSAFVSIMRD